MKAEDQYLKFVRWEEEAYRHLCGLVQEEVGQLRQAGKELPPASMRPMREAVPA